MVSRPGDVLQLIKTAAEAVRLCLTRSSCQERADRNGL
jgi:hypothetical protein